MNKLSVVDVLLFKSHAEYQVRSRLTAENELILREGCFFLLTPRLQETMNFWKQTNHIMAYFKEENFRGDKRLPSSFMTGFLEVSAESPVLGWDHG